MIQERVKEEDCNAGAIFDNLYSSYFPNVKIIIDAICESLPKQKKQQQKNKKQKKQKPNDNTQYEVCTNYRYMRRKEEGLNNALTQKKDDQTTGLLGETVDSKKKAKKAPQVKGLKKSQKKGEE